MVIDSYSHEITATFDAGEFPIRLHFSPTGEHALVSNHQEHSVELFETKSRKSVGEIETPGRPIGILFEPDGEHAWVARSQADSVSRIDLKTFEFVGHVATGKTPDGLAWAEPQDGAPGGGE